MSGIVFICLCLDRGGPVRAAEPALRPGHHQRHLQVQRRAGAGLPWVSHRSQPSRGGEVRPRPQEVRHQAVCIIWLTSIPAGISRARLGLKL